jgi:hypothetical protein
LFHRFPTASLGPKSSSECGGSNQSGNGMKETVSRRTIVFYRTNSAITSWHATG